MSKGSRPGRVNYSTFVDCVRDLATSRPLTSASYGAGENIIRDSGKWDGRDFARLGIVRVPDDVATEELLQVIARKIRSRAAVTGGSTQTFLAIDEDRSGSITVDDFQ